VTVAWTAAARYSVAFVETGLPNGTSWSATLGGSTHTSTGTRVSFSEPNGTYAYDVASVGNFSVNGSATGNVTVHGQNASVSVAFQASTGIRFTLVFQASGVPIGTNWSVTLSAQTYGATLQTTALLTRWSNGAATIRFQVSEGNYTYTATCPGYRLASGPVEVSGTPPATVTVLFVPVSPGPSSNGSGAALPGWAVGVGIGFVLIGAVGLAATVYRLRSRQRSEGRELVDRLLDRAGDFEESQLTGTGGGPPGVPPGSR
jgi:hypothetical protein